MVAAANMVEVAALVGDTARATILAALMGGQALTGSELAFLARISRPTASEHLTKLVEARLIAVTKKRRYCYYRIASPLVARMLESIKAVAAIEVPPRYKPRSAQDDALRFARTCYDHLAGQLGVAIADSLVAKWAHCPDRGGWGGDRRRVEVLDSFRRRFDFTVSKQTHLLSTLPGLERAAIPRCRSCGLGDLATVPGAGLAGARARYARGADHLGRTSRPAREIRLGPGP
jgi:DNA-binding transcriptional ArsR family regulator